MRWVTLTVMPQDFDDPDDSSEVPLAHRSAFREKLWRIVFEAETPEGKAFDVGLLWVIVLSVLVVLLESIPELETQWRQSLTIAEWFFTIVFSLEYLLRIYLVRRKRRYVFSFFGIVDLLSCLPTYLAFFIPGAQSLLVIRILRLLRAFRVLKMIHHVQGANLILKALLSSRAKISVFFVFIVSTSVVFGTCLYLIESSQEGTKFTNIPISIYYTIITITTIGFGDITPQTPLGMILTSMAGLLGYAVVAVPTGIITADIAYATKQQGNANRACQDCGSDGQPINAKYCHRCGELMKAPKKLFDL